MKDKKELCCRCATYIFWGLGALFLLRIWHYQKSLPDPLGAYIQFTVMFLATFYVLALLPIKHYINRLLSRMWASPETPAGPSL